MQNKVNILVPELGPSQRNYYLIRNLNHHLEQKGNINNVNVFAENLSRFCLTPAFAVMNVAEAWGQPGNFVATSLSTASKLMTYPMAKRKFFYVWDLEFLRGEQRSYDNYAPVYLNKDFELICRSKEHADIIYNSFNLVVDHVVENFELNKLFEIMR